MVDKHDLPLYSLTHKAHGRPTLYFSEINPPFVRSTLTQFPLQLRHSLRENYCFEAALKVVDGLRPQYILLSEFESSGGRYYLEACLHIIASNGYKHVGTYPQVHWFWASLGPDTNENFMHLY